MNGRHGAIVKLKRDIAEIRLIMRWNPAGLVRRTDVYLTPAGGIRWKCCAGETRTAAVGLSIIVRTIQKLYLETRTRTKLLRWSIETAARIQAMTPDTGR